MFILKIHRMLLIFLINDAITREKDGLTRTYLILNDESWLRGVLQIEGYFSIALNNLYFSKDVDGDVLKSFFGNSGKQNCPAYLI